MLRRGKNYSRFFFLSTGLCARRASRATRPLPATPAPPARQSPARLPPISRYGHLYVFNAEPQKSFARRARPIPTRRKASKYAGCGPVDNDTACACRGCALFSHHRRVNPTRFHNVRDTRNSWRTNHRARRAGSQPKYFSRGPGIQALKRIICAKLRNFREPHKRRTRIGCRCARCEFRRFSCAYARRKTDAFDRQCSSLSINSAYASGSSSSSVSSVRLLGLTTKIQPSPNASSLIVSGLSASALLTETTLPETGA